MTVHDSIALHTPIMVHAMFMKRKRQTFKFEFFFFLKKKGRKMKKRTKKKELEEGLVEYPGNAFDCC